MNLRALIRPVCWFVGHAAPELVPFFGAHRCPRCHALADDRHVSDDAIASINRKARIRERA